jgi:hypothetical protein
MLNVVSGSFAKLIKLDTKRRTTIGATFLLPANNALNTWKGKASEAILVPTVPLDVLWIVTSEGSGFLNIPPARQDPTAVCPGMVYLAEAPIPVIHQRSFAQIQGTFLQSGIRKLNLITGIFP